VSPIEVVPEQVESSVETVFTVEAAADAAWDDMSELFDGLARALPWSAGGAGLDQQPPTFGSSVRLGAR
jgi:hypothetical protein